MTAPRSQHEAVVKKWTTWLGQIKGHVLELHHHRAIWLAISDAISNRAGDTSGVFRAHYTKLYVDGQAMAIRRLVDPKDHDSISLGRLILDIRNQKDVLTRQRYVDLHVTDDVREWVKENWACRATKLFDEEWGDGSGSLDPVKIDADLNELVTLSAVVWT